MTAVTRTTLEGIVAMLAALALIWLAPPAAPPGARDPAARSDCRAADGLRVSHVVRQFARLQAIADPSGIVLVTRPSVCAAAAEALNALLDQPGVVRHVWVYRLGRDFAVEDPDSAEERNTLFIFDRRFAYKRTLIGS